MTTEIVPAANVAELEALSPEAREVAVTHMLDEARSWLAHAVEATEPRRIAEFRAFMATVAETTRQLGLARAIQLDAQEMVRRAERGVGVAIRRGQESGEIATREEMTSYAGRVAQRHDETESLDRKPAPSDFVPNSDDLTANGAGIYHLTDGVPDEAFEAGLADAKEERNLSRANVVRKVQSRAAGTESDVDLSTPAGRRARIAELAAQNYSSRQIASMIGMTEDHLGRVIRKDGIDVPADKVMARTKRLNSDRIVEETTHALDGLRMGLELVDFDALDPEKIPAWSASLTASLRSLNQFARRLKEADPP